MESNRRVILLRFARSAAAVAVSAVAAWIVGPEGLELIPDQFDELVVLIGAPALLALEKQLRDGGDARS
jgi:hypothetical protein